MIKDPGIKGVLNQARKLWWGIILFYIAVIIIASLFYLKFLLLRILMHFHENIFLLYKMF